MSDKKLILMTIYGFGLGCVAVLLMVWQTARHWGTWRMWLFIVLGIVNVAVNVRLVRSHLRWFDSRIELEAIKTRFETVKEIFEIREVFDEEES